MSKIIVNVKEVDKVGELEYGLVIENKGNVIYTCSNIFTDNPDSLINKKLEGRLIEQSTNENITIHKKQIKTIITSKNIKTLHVPIKIIGEIIYKKDHEIILDAGFNIEFTIADRFSKILNVGDYIEIKGPYSLWFLV